MNRYKASKYNISKRIAKSTTNNIGQRNTDIKVHGINLFFHIKTKTIIESKKERE
jgi:hypothetical protein